VATNLVQKVLKSRFALVLLALAAVGLAIPAVRHLREQPPPPPPPISLTLGPPPGTELGSGDEALDAAISPDERRIVFSASNQGTASLWMRALDSDEAEALRGTEGAQRPAWTSAGNAVSFFADGRLRQISLSDGTVSDLAEAPSAGGAAWLPDGSVLFAARAQGAIQKLQGGTVSDATQLQADDRAHLSPSTAGANSFVYTAVGKNGRRTVRLVRGSEERDLTPTSGHGQIAGGFLLYARDNAVLARKLDEGTGTLVGQTVPVASGVGVTANGRSLFVASRRMLLSAPASPRARALTWIGFDGRHVGTTGEPGEFWQVRLSPDDEYAAVTMTAPLLRTLDVTLVPTGRRAEAEPLTLAVAADSDPVWSPDGRRVAFRSLQKGRPALFTKRVRAADAEDELLLDADVTPTDWRGSSVLLHGVDAASGQDIFTVDAVRGSRAHVVKSGFNDTDGRQSPDGRWLAYVSDESGRPDIYLQQRPDGDRIRVSMAGGTRPRWSRDGRSLFFLRGSTIMRALMQEGAPAALDPEAVIDLPGVRDFDVAHRRDALLALVPVAGASSAPVSAIIDWQSALSDAR
jgi:Tol biopolymer transport system component